MMDSEEIKKRMACPCCGACDLDPRMVQNIRHVFGMLGHELRITSGYRCLEHNAEVGGAPRSMHLRGKAVDLAVSDPDEQEDIAATAKSLGFGGIGWGKNFIHLDLGEPREWRYGADGKPVYKKTGA